ncbi:cytoplasmic protein [Rhodanobacter denitrificans]|uniref:cytoplasmic protein n=1 Tax=Rhodanobacter denitrificans TaxID=666685 RepID=UPI001F36CA0C|nr:cytoplasmic protein [Rhodanobacter denitrificans]UJJ60239.1 cytoplasmic protein [Rhodanobacter denitrificans]
MNTYRLVIKRQGALVGNLDFASTTALDGIRDIARHLAAADGCTLELQVESGQRRLLESTPEGIRLLAAEVLFRAAPRALLQDACAQAAL